MRAGRTIIVAAMLVACVSCAARPGREPWTFHDEEYSCTTAGMSLEEMKSAGVTVVSHVPCTKETFDKAHALGLRVMPYVSLYKAIDSSEGPGFLKHPFWRELDLVKHPGWVLVRPDGTRRRPFDNPNYSVGLHQSCCNAPGIHEAYVRGIKAVMDLGADGVFVDNVHPYRTCYGVELGIPGHTHMEPDKNNAEMYKAALKKVYDAVKSYGPDKIVMLNSGGPRHEFGGLGDVLMWESYICSWAWDSRRPDWPGVLRGAGKWDGYVRSGKAVAPLCYLNNTPWGQIDDAYYTYACARLGQFHWTATSRHPDVLRLLHRARLGKPTGAIAEAGGVTYRPFELGVVAVNPSDKPLIARLPRPARCEQPTDLYAVAMLEADRKTFAATIPPESGRVYLARRAVAASLVEEVRLSASEIARRIGELDAAGQSGAAKTLDLLGQVQDIAEGAKRSLDDLPSATRAMAGAPALLDQLPDPSRAATPTQALFAPDGVRTEAEVLALLRSLGSGEEPKVTVGPGRITLSSGGAQFRVLAERAMLRFPSGSASFWAVRGGKGRHGWRHPAKFEGTRLAVDTPDRKVVATTVRLRGKVSGEIDRGFVVDFEAEVRRGLPCLFTRATLRNLGPKASVYAFWAIGARYATTVGPETHEMKGRGAKRQAEWVLVHRRKGGGPGVLVLKPTNAADGAGQLNLFAEPKTQMLAQGGTMLIGAGFASPDGGWLADKTIVRHLANLRRAVPKALGILSGVELRAQARRDIVAGVPEPVRLRLVAHDQPLVAGPATFAFALPDGWRAVPQASDRADAAAFVVTAPADAKGRERFAARAIARLADGTPVHVQADLQAVVQAPVRVSATTVGAGEAGQAELRVELQSFLPTDVTADLILALPKGWQGQAAATGIEIPAGQSKAVALRVQPPADATGRQTAIESTLTLRGTHTATLRTKHQVAVAPLLRAERVTQPPTLDGALDDPCWQGAEKVIGFVHHKTGKPVSQQTIARVAWDDTCLYVAFDCRESQMKSIRAAVKPDEAGKARLVPRDDSVELYLDTAFTRQRAAQFVVNALGARKSGAGIAFEAAARRRADGWSVELRIPFSTLRAKPKVGGSWGINLCRNQWRLGEFSCWSCTRGAYSNPKRMGVALFEDKIH